MNLESLLLSRDVEVMRILRPALEKLAIDVQICQESAEATEILLSEKFDAVIVDCDDLPGGLGVLQELRAHNRTSPSNSSCNTPRNSKEVSRTLYNDRLCGCYHRSNMLR